MTHVHVSKKPNETIPAVALWSMFAMVILVLCAVTIAKVIGMPATATPPAADQSGVVRVYHEDGTLLADMSGDEGGFIAGVGRVIDRNRTQAGAPLDAPVHIIWRDNNRLSIFDPQTEWQADLMGFGAVNSRAFAMLVAKAMKGK
jgi:putative photosynthetic complex assembly protein